MKIIEVGVGFTQEHEMSKFTWGLITLFKTIWPSKTISQLIEKLPPKMREEVKSLAIDAPMRGRSFDAAFIDEVSPL